MKSKQKKINKTTLSDKIADALTVKPRADIEDDHIFNTKPNTVTRADFNLSESEDEAIISDFRKRNVNLLSDISKKYEGKVVSRKELDQISDESSEEENTGKRIESSDEGEESDDNSIKKKFLKNIYESDSSENELAEDDRKQNDKNKDYDSDDTEADEEEDGSGDDDDNDDEEGYDISQMNEPIQEEFEHVKKENVSEEAKKGTCVRNQLLLWEGLLEMRIHMQRCVNTANRMPMLETYNDFKACNEFVAESSTAISNVATVLDKLMTLQNMLFKNFPETKTLTNNKNNKDIVDTNKKNAESDEEIPSDTDNEEIPSDTEPEDEPEKEKPVIEKQKVNKKKRKLEDYESDIATTHKNFKTFRDTTIQKWNEKTRIATVANIKTAPTNTILQQISYILSDRQKLVRRTQLKRSEYDIIGHKKESIDDENKEQGEVNLVTRDRKDNDEYIPEIFDDSDFYHQLLRELIECKSADISDPIQLSRQWIALQQMRSKMKRKVDTKATKGRKIKYVVHNKLVNYMAPEKSSKWNEESTTELYNSLFGKMFEQNNIGLNINLENVSIKN